MAQAIAHADSPLGVVTVSMGVALLVPEDDNSPEILIKLADQVNQARAAYRVEEAFGESWRTDAGSGLMEHGLRPRKARL